MVSVIVPVYNAEKTLTICVQSVLDQTYKDWELILIDDGSTDRSGQICEELQEKCLAQNRPCRVVYQENRGVSAARNCGMELAAGEYFVCIDSDDRIEPCYLEDLVQTAEAHPEFGHILCGFRCTSYVHDYILTNREPLSVVDRRDYMSLFQSVLIQGPCLSLYKTAIVRSAGIKMREDLSRAEDIMFNLEYLDALGQVPIGVVNKPNYIYQNEDIGSLFRRYSPDLLEINEMVNQALLGYLKKWNVEKQTSWQLYDSVVLANYISVLDNTFHVQNPMTRREKIAYNNRIMEKESFQEALKKGRFPVSGPLQTAYQSGDYRRVLTVKRINDVKRFVRSLVGR